MTSAEIASPAPRVSWTSRQKEVLDLLACGYTNAEIAERLDISLQGAKWHVSEVMSILGVASRDEAADYWRKERSLHRRLARALGLLAVPAKALAIGAGIALAGIVAVVIAIAVFSDDDSTPGAVPDGTGTPSATETAEPTGTATANPSAEPTPAPLDSTFAIYTRSIGTENAEGRGWDIREVVVHDLESGEEARWQYSDVGAYPVAASLAGNFVFTATEQEIVRWNLDGTGRTSIFAFDDEGLAIANISASPDGTFVAATVYCLGCDSEMADGVVIFFDAASGSELGRVEKEADFPSFLGWPWIIYWRADGAGVLVTGARHSEAPGGRMTVRLDGNVIVHTEADGFPVAGGLPSPAATLLARGSRPQIGCSNPTVEVFDFDLGQAGAQLTIGGLGLAPRRWHPEEIGILVQAYDWTGITDCLGGSPVDRGLFEMDTVTGAATPVTDELSLLRAWYGAGHLEVRCNDGSTLIESAEEHVHLFCTGPADDFAHMDALIIDGITFGSGFDVEYLGLAGRPRLIVSSQ